MTAGDVPAGGAGADSGAVDSTRIDPDDTARIQNIGRENDVPGVGTRAADGSMENAATQPRAADQSDSPESPFDRDRAETGSEGASPTEEAEADDASGDDDGSRRGMSIDELQPGVDRDHARQSRIVDKD